MLDVHNLRLDCAAGGCGLLKFALLRAVVDLHALLQQTTQDVCAGTYTWHTKWKGVCA